MSMVIGGPNYYDGSWCPHYFCVQCDHEVTWWQMMQSHACCPYCAHTVEGTVIATVTRPMRWVPTKREWWQVWRIFQGRFEEAKP